MNENLLSVFNIRSLVRLSEMIGINTKFLVSSVDFKNDFIGHKKTEYIVNNIAPEEFYNFSNGIEKGIHQVEFYSKIFVKLYKQEYNHP